MDSGPGRVDNWVLLRGLGRQQGHWDRFPDVLQETDPEVRLLLLDLPGAGSEHRRTAPWSLRGFVQDLRGRWLPGRADRPGSWGLLGLSLGAMVALRWGALHRGDFARIVAVNASAADLSPPWRRLTPLAWRGLLRAARTRDAEQREALIISLISNTRACDRALIRRWTEVEEAQPFAMHNFVRQMAAGSLFCCPGRIDTEVRVVVGEGDRFVDPVCSRSLARRLGAALHVHPTAGHELGLDDPGWLAESATVPGTVRGRSPGRRRWGAA